MNQPRPPEPEETPKTSSAAINVRHANAQPTLNPVRIDGNAAGSKRLVAADELRALLREVGDLATREARILQNELSTLDDSLAQSFQQSDLSGSYNRRWRTKA